jgi:hypothetical protein
MCCCGILDDRWLRVSWKDSLLVHPALSVRFGASQRSDSDTPANDSPRLGESVERCSFGIFRILLKDLVEIQIRLKRRGVWQRYGFVLLR